MLMYRYNLDYYQIMMTICILIIAYILTLSIGVKRRPDAFIISLIYVWHTVFSIIYYLFSLTNISDAKGYYRESLNLDYNSFSFRPGTEFVNYLTSIFTQIIGSNYFNTTLIFGSFGTIGLILLFLSVKRYIEQLSIYWILLLFLPSMSFWSASLSKDSLSFFSVCLFLYAITIAENTKVLKIILSLIVMFLVRPHVAGIMLVSYGVYFIFVSKIHPLLKLLIIPFLFTILIGTISFAEEYAGIGESSLEGYSSYIENRETVSQVGGSAVDLTSMSFPMKLFTYVFRPLPYEAHSITALITSLENVVLIILSLYTLLKNNINTRYFFEDKNFWLASYVLILWTVFALTTANLGIATRQKWMFVPIMLYLLIYVRYKNIFPTKEVL